MAEVSLRTVDSFTDKPFSGNPAAVVMLDQAPSDDWMAAVARETNLSDTGFVIRETLPDADYRLRWFTQGAVEVDLCGHATLAAAHCLLEDGVGVRRALRNGRLKSTKTEGSIRAVPLQAIALAALDQLRADREIQLLFPSPRGGYFDLHNFRTRYWKPAQIAAGIVPLRRVYDLRHTFATFALRAGISTFDLSRYMGASLTMIDRHYGHLARDGREHAIRLLDSYGGIKAADVQRLDVRWTPQLSIVANQDNGNHG